MARLPSKKKATARAGAARTGNGPRVQRQGVARPPVSRPAVSSPRRSPAPPVKKTAPAETLPPARAMEAASDGTPTAPPPPLTEEEQIESAKYLPRDLPPRVFEEERFLFPDSYGRDRIRLLVKDPDWLFAHWDVDQRVFESLRRSLGERGAALTRLTLRVSDVANGGSTQVLLPFGARTWYVRTDRRRRSYRAELGLTLPSGEFRSLAQSNVVMTPPVGPSPRRAQRRVRYDPVQPPGPELAAQETPASPVGAWAPGSAAQASAEPGETAGSEPGGASDIFRR
ncbi:MAG TPA: DUF4912 domain-containing protein [Vicinamibacteria bacterium]|jgi:hypothetical protein|nr:DUF4912 domain-containing protein [Vicinamibacteria bacterium]